MIAINGEQVIKLSDCEGSIDPDQVPVFLLRLCWCCCCDVHDKDLLATQYATSSSRLQTDLRTSLHQVADEHNDTSIDDFARKFSFLSVKLHSIPIPCHRRRQAEPCHVLSHAHINEHSFSKWSDALTRTSVARHIFHRKEIQ